MVDWILTALYFFAPTCLCWTLIYQSNSSQTKPNIFIKTPGYAVLLCTALHCSKPIYTDQKVMAWWFGLVWRGLAHLSNYILINYGIAQPAAGEIMTWWSKVFTKCPPYATVLWFLCKTKLWESNIDDFRSIISQQKFFQLLIWGYICRHCPIFIEDA